MKRVLALLLTMVVSAGLLAACAPDNKPCEHAWSEWTVVQQATCTEKGQEKRTCGKCKEEELRDIAAGHKWGEWKIVKQPSCTTDEGGSQERECSVCREKQTEQLPAWGKHDYVEKVTEGDCTTETVTWYTCSHCGDKYKVTGNKVSDKHVSETFACGKHCKFCSSNANHAESNCGVAGHFMCDGFEHMQCAIPKADNMQFSEVNGGLRFDGFNAPSDSTEVFIPAFVDGKPVVEIADAALEGIEGAVNKGETVTWLDTVAYVFVPDTVTTIGKYFAYDMNGLKTIRMPKKVDKWGVNTFFTVPSLETLTIPRGVKTLSGNVGNGTDDFDFALNTVTLPSSFENLESIKLFFYFDSCKVETINFEGDETAWAELIEKVTDTTVKQKLQAASVNYNYDYNAMYKAEYADMQVRLTGCEFAATEGGYTIKGFNKIMEKMTVPAEILGKPVVSISDNVFSGEKMKAVKEIVFSGDIKEIGDFNFFGMDSLVSVVLPDSVTRVGAQCFYNCKNLIKVVIPADAVMDMSRSAFADCPALEEITLPANFENVCEQGAFSNIKTGVKINCAGTQTVWYLTVKAASANLAAAEITFNGGKQTEKDNGAEYLLNEDGESYTLVGFYDAVKDPDGNPIAGYTVPETFNGKPITKIGAAVFNANAYENQTITDWMKGMGALIIGVMVPPEKEGDAVQWLDNKVTVIGDFNFVGMSSLTQLRLPSKLDNKVMKGCFSDLNGATFLRVPRGVEILEDCFQWSGSFFGGNPGRWLVLPASLKEFAGNCWTGTASAFGFVFDCKNEVAVDTLTALLDASKCTTPAWEGAIVPFFKTFANPAAGLVLGEGNQHGFSYDLFIGLGF